MTINCKGKLIDLTTPKVMGILNLTPDSFYDGGKYTNENECFEETFTNLELFLRMKKYVGSPRRDHAMSCFREWLNVFQ